MRTCVEGSIASVHPRALEGTGKTSQKGKVESAASNSRRSGRS